MTTSDAADGGAAASDASDHADRVTNLEVRLAFLEHTLTQLDDVVRETADENVRLRRMMTELRQRVEQAADPGAADGTTDLEYERPPHY
jgi:uncharacterized coiled-coil protein SlyX